MTRPHAVPVAGNLPAAAVTTFRTAPHPARGGFLFGRNAVVLLASALLAACASGPLAVPEVVSAIAPASVTPLIQMLDDASRVADITMAASDFERDRRAILAMLGEYQVRFAFTETVVLKPGYERRPFKDTGAFETVVLVEDSGRRIVLQHLLVSDDGQIVTKHWRQDWTFEASSRFEFTEDQTWRLRLLSPQVTRNTWTQCVYEVSDAPRYCGTGRWTHGNDAPTWTSDATWRPLPRREYTTRNDYNALDAQNRHTITPSGWTHEQQNTKTVRAGETTKEALVREFGFNDYRRIEGFDFSPAITYWNGTRTLWARVRDQWDQRIAAGRGIHLKTPVDGMALIMPLFLLAEAVQAGTNVDDATITDLFDKWTTAAVAVP